MTNFWDVSVKNDKLMISRDEHPNYFEQAIVAELPITVKPQVLLELPTTNAETILLSESQFNIQILGKWPDDNIHTFISRTAHMRNSQTAFAGVNLCDDDDDDPAGAKEIVGDAPTNKKRKASTSKETTTTTKKKKDPNAPKNAKSGKLVVVDMFIVYSISNIIYHSHLMYNDKQINPIIVV